MEAGTLDAISGYRRVMLRRRNRLAHRLAWFLVTGEWPKNTIDHINGNKSDNRWANLRDVAVQTNSQNERRARRNNRSGFLGVRKNRVGMYVAAIGIDYGKRHLGSFKTPEEAHAAYIAAKRLHHEGNTL
jgi:hypothetical protein